MTGDSISGAMMWAGALMVFTPMIAVGVVVAVLWLQKRRRVIEQGGQQGQEGQ